MVVIPHQQATRKEGVMSADQPLAPPEEVVRRSITRSRLLKQTGAVVGFAGLFGIAGTASASPSDTTQGILNAAVTAEQIATVLYYEAIAGPTAANLSPVHNHNNINYFQAALWEEYQHIQLLSARGGTSLTGSATPTIYFPSGAFANSGNFPSLLDTLENAFIGAYLAAVSYWASQSLPGFAEDAAQIMGIEAEHRALGRVTSGSNPPNNLIVEGALFNSVSQAVPALVPFVQRGSGYTAYTFPSDAQIRGATTAGIIQSISDPGLVA
jgi:hypothetical protein